MRLERLFQMLAADENPAHRTSFGNNLKYAIKLPFRDLFQAFFLAHASC
jgi:hypothetical protein